MRKLFADSYWLLALVCIFFNNTKTPFYLILRNFLALAKNKESWLQKLKETEELSHIAGPKDLKIQELEVCN